jgi:hypothetical protein
MRIAAATLVATRATTAGATCSRKTRAAVTPYSTTVARYWKRAAIMTTTKHGEYGAYSGAYINRKIVPPPITETAIPKIPKHSAIADSRTIRR